MSVETGETKIVETDLKPSGAPAKGLIDQSNRGEVSALTISRMLGLATVTDLQLLEGKLDLVATRVQTFSTKLEKLATMLSSAPTGSDLERIDVQISSLKSMLKEFMTTGKVGSAADNHSAEDTKKAIKILSSRQKGEGSDEGKPSEEPKS